MSQKRKRRRSAPFHVYYEMDTSENNFDEIITVPNPDDSGSDNSDSDADWDEEVTNITYREACKAYTEDQAKLEGNHEFYWVDGEKKYPDIIEDNIMLKKLMEKKYKTVSLWNFLKHSFLLK